MSVATLLGPNLVNTNEVGGNCWFLTNGFDVSKVVGVLIISLEQTSTALSVSPSTNLENRMYVILLIRLFL